MNIGEGLVTIFAHRAIVRRLDAVAVVVHRCANARCVCAARRLHVGVSTSDQCPVDRSRAKRHKRATAVTTRLWSPKVENVLASGGLAIEDWRFVNNSL